MKVVQCISWKTKCARKNFKCLATLGLPLRKLGPLILKMQHSTARQAKQRISTNLVHHWSKKRSFLCVQTNWVCPTGTQRFCKNWLWLESQVVDCDSSGVESFCEKRDSSRFESPFVSTWFESIPSHQILYSSRVIDSSHAITGKCLYILFHLSLGLELLNRAFQGSSVHELSNKYYTMGVDRASGCIWAMASEVYNLTKVVPRLSENGDVIKTQIIICAMLSSNFVQGRPKFFAQVPRNCWDQHFQYIHCFYSIQYKF